MKTQFDIHRFVRSKIVATVGPVSREIDILTELINDGVNVFRINTAHGDRAEHEQVLANIREASRNAGMTVGVLVDLAGPKIRLGQLFEEPLKCPYDSRLTFIRGTDSADVSELTSNYDRLIDDANLGDQILLADGIVRIEVVEKSTDRLECRVLDGGEIRSRQGIALPGVKLSLPALSEKDLDNAVWAAHSEVDFISLSFVTAAEEINQLRQVVGEHGSEAAIVAKIEKREALDNLEQIILASDVVMVARGDLGVEIPIESTTLAQKRIIRACRDAFRPVIVATQMLDSMQHSTYPTRAEVSDVSNAILDGADACMLSGETAIGDNPRAVVKMMRRIMAETETIMSDRIPKIWSWENLSNENEVTRAVVYGAAHIADRINAKLMVIGTSNGDAARLRSKLRDAVPTLAVSSNQEVLQKLCLLWGVFPIAVQDVDIANAKDLQTFVNELARTDCGLQAGDSIVFVANTEFLPGVHDMVMVGEVH